LIEAVREAVEYGEAVAAGDITVAPDVF